ncbi:MAG: hypothetical protein WAT14_04995 [Chitinophagaceae bacterium]
MFRLIIAIIAIPALLAKYYSWIVKKEKLDYKSVVILLFATVVAALMIYEWFFPNSIY